MLFSGGLINYMKSFFYGWNVSRQSLHNIANIFGVPCKQKWDHFNYLGMSISANYLKAEVWNMTLEKMKRKVHQ